MKGKKKPTKHHIIPTSRGGRETRRVENTCIVPDRQHKLYHHLFANRTPDEIIDYLVEDFWAGQTEHVDRYYERFGRKNTR